ncbi:alpha/beta-hydrolase family protein [Corynebacterium falsenii]|uniref:alpha/beta-hydrolase family protein n=1 Tax=Corynebacterium falsenii TaxID=108486 RepID=UPI003FD3DE52
MRLPGLSTVLRVAAGALDVYVDLFPGVRLTRRKIVSPSMGAGILGAEIATWNALAPSLLPHPWWAVAANTATSQAVGHFNGTLVAAVLRKLGVRNQERFTQSSLSTPHLVAALMTAVLAVRSYRLQGQSAELVRSQRHGARSAAAGIAVGTIGYGGLLIVGEAVQGSYSLTNRSLRRVFPAPLAMFASAIALVAAGFVVSDKVLLRAVLERLSASAEQVNRRVYDGFQQPWEPERSGSVWSYEKWISLGAQGRVLVGGGPRARDIREVLGVEEAPASDYTPADPIEIREPIRIYGGLVPGRSLETIVHMCIREIMRTGALRRSVIAIHTSTGTGWVPDWQVDTVEFLTGGDCATVTMQYSFVQSPIAYMIDRDTPARAGQLLINAVLELIEDMPDPPKVFVVGESLGAYGTCSAFCDGDELLRRVDGAVLSGAPRFTRIIRSWTHQREHGSPERLPVVDGGRHVRFVAHPDHLRRDWRGRDYEHEWECSRVVVAQFPSDAIVWWSPELFYRQPQWLREPGSRGVAAPPTQHVDVVDALWWVPFTTGWQVALDMLTAKHAPSDHGHNYRAIMVPIWRDVLGDAVKVHYTPDLERRIVEWIMAHSRDTRQGPDRFA